MSFGFGGVGAINFNGLVSGLDTNAIINRLVSITKASEAPLQAQIATLNNKNSSLNNLNSRLSGILTSLANLLLSSTFLAKLATPADSTIFTASADSTAVPGTYTVNVQQLASATSVSSQTGGTPVSSAPQGIGTAVNNTTPQTIANVLGRFADPDIPLQYAGLPTAPTSGSFTLTHNGTTTTFTVNATTDSLRSILNQISAAPGLGITATLSGDKVTLTASDANAIGVGAGSDTSNFLSVTNLATGVISAGPPYSVTSSVHLGSVNSSAVLTQASTSLTTPGAAPALALAAGGSLTVGDTFEVEVVGFNANGYLTAASPAATMATSAGNQTINVTYAPVSGASGHLIFVRDVTAGETTYQAIAVDNSGSASISAHTARERINPSFNATGGSVANFFPGTAGPVVPTTGTFTVNGVSFTIGSTDTLSTVLTTINNSAAGVTAVFNASLDTVTLTNKNTGSSSITLSNGTSNFLTATDLLGATQTIGLQSKVSINGGASIFNNSNTVTNAISGVTLNLLKTGTASLTVSNDSKPATDALNGLVSSLNSFETDVFNSTKAPVFNGKKQTKPPGVLFGDFLVVQGQLDVENTVITPLRNFTGPFISLEDLGLSFTQTQGQANSFSLDSSKLTSAIGSNPQAVSNLVTKIAKNLETLAKGLTDANAGFPAIVAGNNKTVEALNAQIERIDDQADAQTALLRQQFAAMESALAEQQALQSFLTNQLTLLNNLTSTLFSSRASAGLGGLPVGR